ILIFSRVHLGVVQRQRTLHLLSAHCIERQLAAIGPQRHRPADSQRARSLVRLALGLGSLAFPAFAVLLVPLVRILGVLIFTFDFCSLRIHEAHDIVVYVHLVATPVASLLVLAIELGPLGVVRAIHR